MEEEKIIFRSTSKVEGVFTAAVTNVITSAAHGLQDNDCIQLTTTTTLPAGLALLTNYYVISRTENTFKVSFTPGGLEVDITDIGTGTHTYHLKGKVIYVGDFTTSDLTIDFGSTPTMTIKLQGSVQDSVDLNAAQGADNRWDYVECVDLEDGTAIDGDTGIACAGSVDHRLIEANINGLTWITVAITAYTTGVLNITIRSF